MEPLFRLLELGVPWQRCSLGCADKMVQPEWVDRSAGARTPEWTPRPPRSVGIKYKKIISKNGLILTLKVFLLLSRTCYVQKMDFESNDQQNVHNGMKNSSATNALSEVGAVRDDDQGPPATENASGLTCHSSASGGHRHEELPFVTVSRSKRSTRVQKKNREDPGVPPPPLASVEQSHRDPFGLASAPDDMDPVLCKRFPAARTKQCARKSTAGLETTPPANAQGEQAPPPNTSSGSSSDRSRARLWKKGCILDKAAASKAKKTKLKSARKAAKGPSDESIGTDPSDGASSDTSKASVGNPSLIQSSQKAAVTLPQTGRFNGRVHTTPLDGSCGPAALLEALRHLAQTQGYHFNLPANADDMRRALVADIAENVDLQSPSVECYTLGQEIAAEYFPGDQLLENRQGIFCPDLDEEHFTLVESVQDYLSAMSLRRTHIDEFMLSTFARMWSVRVAVIRPHGKGATTEYSQFVAPNELIPAERTVFLYRSGHHFEWAHANATPCQDPRCRTRNRRISASHTAVCVPLDRDQAQPAKQQSEHAAVTTAPIGSRPSRGSEGDLAILIEQLTEEFPGLSPERAEAALKLTKQSGRYNLYAAAAVLPGREGAPIVLESPSLSRSSGGQSGQDAAGSVYFTDGANATHTEHESGCEDGNKKRRRSRQSSDDEDTAAIMRGPARAGNPLTQGHTTRQEDGTASQQADGNCAQNHAVRETRSSGGGTT